MSSCESRSSGERLQGGYLNSVVYRAGKVHKRYLGFDADARRDLEHATLARLARHVNVPSATLGSDSATLMLEFAEGVNGQDLIRRGQAEPVLRACGESLRQLQAVEPGPLLDVLSGSGSTIVHGDFGPQNMLLDSAAAVTAILDWEFCHLGAPIEDLAWAEWIVRRHHRDAIGWLPALFDGYGSTPDWTLRKRSMVRSIGSMRTFAVATRRVEDVRLWDERLNDLLTWDENEFLLGDGEATE